ncbi:hypothetical protein IWW38_005470, partial [Coemansia aciculifera]
MLAYHASTGSVSSMHQLAPYQPTVAAYNRDASVMAAGSVFDFFQQSHAYSQQYSQQQQQQQQTYQQQLPVADRHPPAYMSYTPGYNASMSPNGTYAVSHAEANSAQSVAASHGAVPDTVHLEAAYNSLGSDSAPKPLPHVPNRYSNVQRRKTIFDNPIYGFAGPTQASQPADEYPAVSSMQQQQPPPPPPAYAAVANYQQQPQQQQQPSAVEQPKKRRDPPPVPQARLPPKPAAYIQEQEQMASASAQQLPPKPPMPTQPLPPRPPPPTVNVRPPSPVVSRKQLQQDHQQLYHVPDGHAFYHHPVAAGSDPSLNGRMHAGGHLRNSMAYDHQAQMLMASN